MAKTPTLALWSVIEGKIVDFDITIEGAEVVACHNDEYIKFPGGISVDELRKLADDHNEANKNVKAITQEEIEADALVASANEQLLEDLK